MPVTQPAQSLDFIHSAMCVWESLLETMNGTHNSELSEYIDGFKETWGIAGVRMESIKLAKWIEALYDVVGEAYDYPFDMQFVPEVIEGLFKSYGHLGMETGFTQSELLAVWLDIGARTKELEIDLLTEIPQLAVRKQEDDLYDVVFELSDGNLESVNLFPNEMAAQNAIAAIHQRAELKRSS